MNYYGLDRVYWDAQIQRVEQLRQKISARAVGVGGREVFGDHVSVDELVDGKRSLQQRRRSR